MKRIIVILCMVFLLTGCNSNQRTDNEYFVRIDTQQADLSKYTIVYAKDTKVKYLIYRTTYGAGITPLYNADGSLQIYEGE